METIFGSFVYLISIYVYEACVKSNRIVTKRANHSLSRLRNKFRHPDPDGSVRLFDYEASMIQKVRGIYDQQRFRFKILKISMMLVWSISFKFFGFQYIFDLYFPDKAELIAPIAEDFLLYTSFVDFFFNYIGLGIAFVLVIVLSKIKLFSQRKLFYCCVFAMMMFSLLFEFIHSWSIKIQETQPYDQHYSLNYTTLNETKNITSTTVEGPNPLSVDTIFPLRVFVLLVFISWVLVMRYTDYHKLEIFLKLLFYAGCFEVVRFMISWISLRLADILVPLLILWIV